uniref:Uncharacterized protein n=1 Tax=Sphaerodactylus townsendi TaxID=933632 RepID=A0ACB8E4K5_9SAUR
MSGSETEVLRNSSPDGKPPWRTVVCPAVARRKPLSHFGRRTTVFSQLLSRSKNSLLEQFQTIPIVLILSDSAAAVAGLKKSPSGTKPHTSHHFCKSSEISLALLPAPPAQSSAHNTCERYFA